MILGQVEMPAEPCAHPVALEAEEDWGLVLLFRQAQAGRLAGVREEPMTKEKLVGSWRLVSFKATAGDKSAILSRTSGWIC
jgi:hypothetical protein